MLLKEEEALFQARPSLQEPDGVDGIARNGKPEVDEVVRFLSYSMLANLKDVISSSYLYSLCDE